MLSCMLAVVHPRGSTVEQAVEVLNRAAGADQTFPEAAFWFTRTTDVRTKTRLPSIGDSLLWLKHLEQEADVVRAAVPSEAGECVGLMLGAAQFSLTERKWRFVPGALADNLTSFNGHFGTASQDKLTDLLGLGEDDRPEVSVADDVRLLRLRRHRAGVVLPLRTFTLSIAHRRRSPLPTICAFAARRSDDPTEHRTFAKDRDPTQATFRRFAPQ